MPTTCLPLCAAITGYSLVVTNVNTTQEQTLLTSLGTADSSGPAGTTVSGYNAIQISALT